MMEEGGVILEAEMFWWFSRNEKFHEKITYEEQKAYKVQLVWKKIVKFLKNAQRPQILQRLKENLYQNSVISVIF